MKTVGFFYNVNRVLRMTRKDVDCILRSAKEHYDARVRQAAECGVDGIFYGWSVKLSFVEDQERRDHDEFTLPFSDLDLAGKALEQPVMEETAEEATFRLKLLGQIHDILREINAEHRRINPPDPTEKRD